MAQFSAELVARGIQECVACVDAALPGAQSAVRTHTRAIAASRPADGYQGLHKLFLKREKLAAHLGVARLQLRDITVQVGDYFLNVGNLLCEQGVPLLYFGRASAQIAHLILPLYAGDPANA